MKEGGIVLVAKLLLEAMCKNKDVRKHKKTDRESQGQKQTSDNAMNFMDNAGPTRKHGVGGCCIIYQNKFQKMMISKKPTNLRGN
jgi:hypothetical protein